MMEDYLEVNKILWDARVDMHLHTRFYDREGFLKGQSSLADIELSLLGDIRGKSVLHLQCHFGMDSISLARLGAKVTAVDFSEKAIEEARRLAVEADQEVNFICSDVYELPKVLTEKFDIVFTSYGVIGWLPDMGKWAEVISDFLIPGGVLVFVEFHPVVWMFDSDFNKIEYSYFKKEPIIEMEGTYADKEAPKKHESITWNHSLAEVMQSLMDKDIEIISFQEYEYSPYNCFNKTVGISSGRFQIQSLEGKIPMVYSLVGKLK